MASEGLLFVFSYLLARNVTDLELPFRVLVLALENGLERRPEAGKPVKTLLSQPR